MLQNQERLVLFILVYGDFRDSGQEPTREKSQRIAYMSIKASNFSQRQIVAEKF